MSYKVDDDTIKRAVNCTRNQICLTGEEELRCGPSDVMSGDSADMALLQCPVDMGCVYCQSFGKTSICECPVRVEIFKRYGK